MSVKVISTLELEGDDKVFCTHGSWVKICHAAHLTGDQSIITRNIRYVIPQLLKRHPLMRSRLYLDDYEQSLQVLDYDEEYFNPDLFYSVIETNDQSWPEIVEKECHRNPYTDGGTIAFPLFHFMLLLNDNSQSSNDNLFHLLLFSNHCASDGRSGYILINDFLTLVTSFDLHDRIEPIDTQIIPSKNQLIPRPSGLLYRLLLSADKYFYKRELRNLTQPRIPVRTTVLEGESISYWFQPVKLHFIFTSTSTTLYSRLHEKCQSQQVTLHGPLFACLLLAIHHCFPIQNKNDRYLNPMRVELDFDLRSRLLDSPLTPSTIGHYVGLGSIEFKRRLSLASTRFWILAQKCIEMTNKCVASDEIFFSEHVLNDITKNEQSFTKFANDSLDGRLSEINFANIGKYPFSCDYNQGQVQLRGLHVINNGGIYHTSSVLFITCAGDGQLDISMAHEMESEEKAQEFVDYYVYLIEKCADADIGITLEQLLTNVEQY